MHTPARILGDQSLLLKYLNPNLLVVATTNDGTSAAGGSKVVPSVTLHVIDAVSGRTLESRTHRAATGPVNVLMHENWIQYTYWNRKVRSCGCAGDRRPWAHSSSPFARVAHGHSPSCKSCLPWSCTKGRWASTFHNFTRTAAFAWSASADTAHLCSRLFLVAAVSSTRSTRRQTGPAPSRRTTLLTPWSARRALFCQR